MNKALLAACALVAVPAFAQAPIPGVQAVPVAQIPGPGMMMAGRVQARADVIARTQRRFAMLDTNRDNALDQAEVAAAGQRWRAAGGGGMAAGRMPLDRNAMFDKIDTNRDGSISRDEFARAPRNRGAAMRRDRDGDGQPDRMGGRRMGGMGGGGGMARLFTMADTNRDGRVTLPEATAMGLQRFDRLDANRDGQLTPDERAAGRARWQQMRGS